MKDFPVFTTEYGVASLILKEVPYRQEAYIKIQSTLDPEKLLEECVSFCRICGAEKIYASGYEMLEGFPHHTDIWQMRGKVSLENAGFLFPVTTETVARWRQIHNEKMRRVPNAGTLEARDEKEILDSCGAYFIHNGKDLMGIGWLRDNRLEAMASVFPGAGAQILAALQSLVPDEEIVLEVASENRKAVALYERCGFIRTQEKSRWYRVK